MKNPFRTWLKWWHGGGAENQYDFYRCTSCKHVVNWKQIREGGCKCGSVRLTPTIPRGFEKIQLLLLPWTV